MSNLLQPLLGSVINIAKQAGNTILQLYKAANLGINYKEDHSPVTKADLAAQLIIKQELAKLPESYPILSEEDENLSFALRKTWQMYWLIDPLDGTKEFIKGNDEFSVNIALIKNHQPILGVVYLPVRGECFYAAQGSLAFWHKPGQETQSLELDKLINKQRSKLRVAVSRHHEATQRLQQLLDKIPEYELITCGSALKICLVAKGAADLYPRLGRTAEWDTAAGQCILEAAGGQLLDLTGKPLKYNTKDSLINPEFIAVAKQEIFIKLFSSI